MAKVPEDKSRSQSSGNTVLWVERLNSLGYKITEPRKLILEILEKQSELIDADSIFLKVRQKDPKIGIATVYRTLELLTRLKIICRINAGVEKSLYMLSEDCRKHASVYMVCENCKSIITENKCLKDAIKIRLKEDAEKNILKNCNIKIDNFQIVFSGLCDKCA